MLEIEDLEDRAVDLDVVSGFELVGRDRGESVLIEPNLNVITVPYNSANHPRRATAEAEAQASIIRTQAVAVPALRALSSVEARGLNRRSKLVIMPRIGPLLNRLSYSNVVATLAFFIALGGASYAAVALPAHSVGPRQLRAGAVTPIALGFPLGATSILDRKVEELGNGACNGPFFPGEPAPPCVPPDPRYTSPGRQLHLSIHSAGRLLVSAVAGLRNRGAGEASASVTLRLIVDNSIASEAQVRMSGGQASQVPLQALVSIAPGRHTVGLSTEAEYSSRPENILVAPVSIIAATLPALARSRQ